MIRLILDKLRRLSVIWTIVCLTSIVLGFFWSSSLPQRGLSIVLWVGTLPMWLTELGVGYGRVTLTLPFTRRELARFLWFLSVGMPTLAVAVFGGAGIWIRGASDLPAGAIWKLWFELVLAAGLTFGSGFWLFSGAPRAASAEGRRERWRQAYGWAFFAMILAFGWWLYHSTRGRETKVVIFAVPTLVLTILGWYRAEGLLVDYGGWRGAIPPEQQKTARTDLPPGAGGLALLFRQFALYQLLAVLIGAVGVLALELWENRGHGWLRDPWVWYLLWYVTFMVTLQQLGAIVSQLRHARTLPLTAGQIASLLLTLAVAPFFFASVTVSALVGLTGGVAMDLSVLKAGVMGSGLMGVLGIAMVWHDENRWARLVRIALAFSGSLAAPVYQLAIGEPGLPAWFVAGYALVFVAASWLVLRHLLEANDMTYRRRLQDLPFGQDGTL